MCELDLATSIGFRHILEDGIAALSNAMLDLDRRKYVIKDLAELLAKASRGADLARKGSFFVQSDERKAFQSFLLFGRYLGSEGDSTWREKLHEVSRTFKDLDENLQVSESAKVEAKKLLSDLLNQVSRQGVTFIPEKPEEIKFGG